MTPESMESQGDLGGNHNSCEVCQGDRRMNLVGWMITGALNIHSHTQVTEEERKTRTQAKFPWCRLPAEPRNARDL